MATADKKSLFVNGGNGGPISPTGNPITDSERAQDVARRYRCEFIDLTSFELHHELFRKIPVELMFRYNFVPLEETVDGKLAIAISDPSQLMMIDEISLLLKQRIVTKVSTLKQISDILRSEEHTSELQSQFHLVCRLLLEKKKKIKLIFKGENRKKKRKNTEKK